MKDKETVRLMSDFQHHYDVIGDIHGYADTLTALLGKLGYTERDGCYRHPERRVVFVGDFIDRGPKIRETLRIVRAMVDGGSALAVMGNHELNALLFHTAGPNGDPLRAHTENKVTQHRETLDQLARPHPEEWAEWLAWFRTLPLFLDLGGLRVVHAAWRRASVERVADRRFVDEAFLVAAATPGHPDFEAVSTLLKGPELQLPDGKRYLDRDGGGRRDIRARWFGPREANGKATFRSLVFPPSDAPPEIAVSAEALAGLPEYDESQPPVVFGHYWVPAAEPRCVAPNAVCVDYSVASKSGGLLAAYRWSGETKVSDANLVAESRI